MREATLQAKCIRYLRDLGVYTIKTIVTNSNGAPDLLACIQGKFISFEIKAPGKRPTRLQQYHADRITISGGRYYVIDDFQQFTRIVMQLFREAA